MQLEELFASALGIAKPWKIESLEFDSANKRLDIHVDFEKGATFEYTDDRTGEKANYKAYDKVDKCWRHLNFFEHECYIKTKVPRVKPQDGGIKMILPPWSGVVYGFTLLFEALMMQMCQNMPVHNVGKILKVKDHKLWRMLDCYVQKAMYGGDHSAISAVGMDETSLKKGHNYITMFVDMHKKKTVFISEGKDSSTVTKFAEMLECHNGHREHIKDVSCDMSPAFIKGVREELPAAQITFDKFHILKIINEGVDAVRRAEAKDTPALLGARYALLKNEANLTAKQRATRESLSKLNLKTMQALHIRENFQAIYQAETLEEFQMLLEDWYNWAIKCKLEPIIAAVKTIKNHWDGILRWKSSLINNGILEGLNSIIQAAKRKARGYKIEHYKVMAYLLTGKLNFHALNPYLPT